MPYRLLEPSVGAILSYFGVECRLFRTEPETAGLRDCLGPSAVDRTQKVGRVERLK